jgi:hypothetical protein
MAGSNVINQSGIYGSQGVSAPGNMPGARIGAVSWEDRAGDFWLLGGIGLDSNGVSNYLDDLWKYHAGAWTWVGGSNLGTQNRLGIYGTQVMGDANNIPGARYDAVSWTDSADNFWLFGGFGCDSTGTLGYLNDLWNYSKGEWTWMGGSNVVNEPGMYGTQGVAAPSNRPGARIEAVGWTDTAGNFWLFGGSPGPEGQFHLFNDLWKYGNGEWTWMSGSMEVDQQGMYGTQSIAASTNVPGARVAPTIWADAAGNFWLFGGNGYDSAGELDYLNDMWEYTAGKWIWVAGPNIARQLGIYGTEGTASPGSIPGGRLQAASWKDSSGNFWLFGGLGYDSAGTGGDLNDVWRYEQ